MDGHHVSQTNPMLILLNKLECDVLSNAVVLSAKIYKDGVIEFKYDEKTERLLQEIRTTRKIWASVLKDLNLENGIPI